MLISQLTREKTLKNWSANEPHDVFFHLFKREIAQEELFAFEKLQTIMFLLEGLPVWITT